MIPVKTSSLNLVKYLTRNEISERAANTRNTISQREVIARHSMYEIEKYSTANYTGEVYTVYIIIADIRTLRVHGFR